MKAPLILYAEDDPDDRLLVEIAIKLSGIPNGLRFVHDGEEVLEYLRETGRYAEPGSAPRPGLVLLDLNMPRLGGRETLATMKNDVVLRTIPVVVFTTSNDEADVRACYERGVNSFVVKPAAMAELVEILRGLARYWFEISRLPRETHA